MKLSGTERCELTRSVGIKNGDGHARRSAKNKKNVRELTVDFY